MTAGSCILSLPNAHVIIITVPYAQIYENVSIPSQNVYVDDGGDSESSQYMRDILQVEEQSRCNQLKNKAAQNNIGTCV